METEKNSKCCEKENSFCRTPCEVFSRIVGYLRPVMQWNPGKVAEFAKRQVYKVEK